MCAIQYWVPELKVRVVKYEKDEEWEEFSYGGED
jgi:hypothetical protein